MLTPTFASRFARAGMTSPSGHSLTFDCRADGYARGEACSGLTFLQGDKRQIVDMLGGAVQQDGRSASLTAPNGQAQQSLLVAALQAAHLNVDELMLNEMHGTGTALGDPIEVGSLFAVLLARKEMMSLGGAKANIGHAEPAAGITGFLKLVMAMYRTEAIPNAQLRSLNPYIGDMLSGNMFAIPVQIGLPTSSKNGGVW